MTRTVLVTGGNRGIGFEIVKGFASRGYKVLMACRQKDQGIKALQELNLPGNSVADVHVLALSLDKESSILEAMQNAKAVYGDIDILVNNAGILCDKGIDELSGDDLLHSFQVQVNGPLSLIKLVLPNMKSNGFGRIINISSGWGSFFEGLEGPVAYSTTKAALNALTVGIARTLAENSNLTINSVCPGWVKTRMGGKDAPKTPEEGADTAIWLGTMEGDCPNGLFFRDRTVIQW